MRCPRDGQILDSEVFCGVDIDSCSYCDGTWMDRGELAKVVGLDADLLSDEKVAPEDLNDRPPGSLLTCPRCTDTSMTPYYFSSQKRIILDKCQACGGIWLDTNELKHVVRLAYVESQK